MNPDITPDGALDRPNDFLKPTAPQSIEIAGSFGPAEWIEKSPSGGFITYPGRYQWISSACVAYWIAKQLGVDELSENGVYRELSPRSLYHKGYEPTGGMYSLKAADLASKAGLTLEHLLPSDGKTEEEMRQAPDYTLDARQVGLIYKPDRFLEIPADFESIASVIDGYRAVGKKKVVGITIAGQNNGTWGDLFPKPPSVPMFTNGQFTPGLWAHKVTVTDFGTINGEPYIAIDNTIIKGVTQQLLGREWMPYIYGAMYSLDLPDDWLRKAGDRVEKPRYKWLVDLRVGSSSHDVLMLQKALQALGMFPISEVVKPTGSFFGVTKNSIETFQASFGLPVTGVCDEKTRTLLNQIFGS